MDRTDREGFSEDRLRPFAGRDAVGPGFTDSWPLKRGNDDTSLHSARPRSRASCSETSNSESPKRLANDVTDTRLGRPVCPRKSPRLSIRPICLLDIADITVASLTVIRIRDCFASSRISHSTRFPRRKIAYSCETLLSRATLSIAAPLLA